jgi:hypothetical protein
MSDTLRLTAGLILAAFSVLGYGRLASKLLKIEGTLAADGVIGTTILTAIFAVVHFFFALQQTVNLVTLAPGVLFLAILFRRRFLIEIPLIAVMIWWTVQISRTGVPTWDHGLYHLETMLWNTTDRVVVGLANLHTPLGYNQSLFVLAAGLSIPVFGGWSLSFLATALVEAMMAADFLLSIRSATQRMAQLYCLVVILFLLAEPRWVLSPTYLSPEPVVALGVLYAILLFLDRRKTALLLWVPFLITAKLSSAPLILLLDWNRETLRKPAAAVGALFLGIWVAGNIAISGYLAYPVAVTRLPLAWAMPKSRTIDATRWITSWSRVPERNLEQTSGLKWIRPWANNSYAVPELRWSLLLFVAGFFVVWRKKALRQMNLRALLVISAGLLFWFIAAPDPRFGRGFILSAALLFAAYGMENLKLLQFDAANAGIVVGLFAVWFAFTAGNMSPPDKWPNNPVADVKLAKTPSGYNIWTPVYRDQCFAVMPCSPEPAMIEYYPKAAIPLAPK